MKNKVKFDAYDFPETRKAVQDITYFHDVKYPHLKKEVEYKVEVEFSNMWRDIEQYLIKVGLIPAFKLGKHDKMFRFGSNTTEVYMRYDHQTTDGVKVCTVADHPEIQEILSRVKKIEDALKKEYRPLEEEIKSEQKKNWGTIKSKMVELGLIDPEDTVHLFGSRFVTNYTPTGGDIEEAVEGIKKALEETLGQVGLKGAEVRVHNLTGEGTKDVSGIRGVIERLIGKK